MSATRSPSATAISPLVSTCAALVVVLAAAANAFASAHLGRAWPAPLAQLALSLAGFGGAAVTWRRRDGATLTAIVVAALVARALFLPLDPVYSNDVYRYLWDGRDLLHGIDPYVERPSGLALTTLRAGDWLYPHIDWADVPTLYPPFDLALYGLAALIDARDLLAIKSVLLVGDLVTFGVLAIGLRRSALPIGRLAIYAWNPVVLTEFALGGHEEAWAVAWIVVALVALRAEHLKTSALALAGATLAKLYPVVFVPVFFATRRTIHAAALAALVIALAYLPFLLRTDDALGFLHAFAYGYTFNDSLHEVVGTTGAAILFALTIAVAVAARLRGARLVAVVFCVELAYLVLSPSVYPWYTTIFAALVPLLPFAFRGAFRPLALGTLAWSALSPLAYLDVWVFDQGSFADRLVHDVEYAPLVVGIVLALVRVDRAYVWAEVRALAPRRREAVPAPQPRRAPPPPRIDLRLDAVRDAEPVPSGAAAPRGPAS